MKFQIKVIFATTVIMIVVLFYLNTMVINFMDYVKEDILLKTIERDRIERQSILEEKFKEYVWNVLLWEFLLVLSLMLILYKVIDRMTRQEREYRDFLELLLLTISHKFGNFLTAQKGNIEILNLKNDSIALERLKKSLDFLKEDFDNIIAYIKNFKQFTIKREKINLLDIIKKSINLINKNSQVYFQEKNVFVQANLQMLENIIFPLIENANKYSDGKIFIRHTKKYLAIRNRISITDRGTGVGLKIAEKIAEKQGFRLSYRGKGDYFISLIKFR